MFPAPPGRATGPAVPPLVPRPAPPERLPARTCPAVARLLDSGDADALWAAVRRAGTPLVDDLGDGTCAVTFVVPERPGVTEVRVLPNKLADAAHPGATTAERVPGAWILTLRMPGDWCASYGIAELTAHDPGSTAATSPGTPPPAADTRSADTAGLGATPATSTPVAAALDSPSDATAARLRTRALATVPEAERPALARFLDARAAARPDPFAREHLHDGTSVVSLPRAPVAPPSDGPRGTVLHGLLPATGGPAGAAPGTGPPGARAAPSPDPAGAVPDEGPLRGRRLWLHDPAGADPAEPLPVVVVLDGGTWLADGLPAMLDGAIARGELPAVRTVGVASAPGQARLRELGCDPDVVRLLDEQVLGWAAEQRALDPDPARTVVAGQSLGGLTALYATQVAPHRFGRAVSQSGSFWWPNTGGVAEWLTSALPDGPTSHGVWLECGTEEWVLREPTRRVAEVLRARGDLAGFAEFRGGHDHACWRAGLIPALGRLLG